MENIVRVLTNKRRAVRQNVVQDRAKSIDIASLINPFKLSLSLFRRHVPRRTKNLSLHGRVMPKWLDRGQITFRERFVSLVNNLGQPPVKDHHLTEVSKNH